MYQTLKIRRIDTRHDDIRAAMAELRRRLSPEGNVVSEAGRRRTIEVFGEPLSPVQVVERICRDVKQQGLAAVLDYSARIDKAQLTRRDDPRARARSWPQAHAQADPQLLAAVRRVSASASAGFRRRSCTATSAWTCRADTWCSVTGRWSAWASACRAGRPPIRRPC